MCKLARALRLVLAVELALYAALAVWVGLRAGWAQALAAVLTAALVLRAGPILLSYVIAYLHASPMPRDGRIGPLRLLGALLTEIGVAVLLFAVLMPFQRNPRTTPSGGGRPPIVLVHAYLCSAGSWGSMRRRLAGRGYDAFTVDLDPFWDIDRYAPVLARHVDEVRARTGAGKVVLIGHSMGGLVIRAFARPRPAACRARDHARLAASRQRARPAGAGRVRPADAPGQPMAACAGNRRAGCVPRALHVHL
jgi:triacylglycerol lipase